jgi:hypothetical protein
MILERTDLIDKLDEFHNMVGATPAEIRNLALEVSFNLTVCIIVVLFIR